MNGKMQNVQLYRAYEKKAVHEVALRGDTISVIGQDLWIAKHLRSMKRVLDVGCGTGRMSKLLNGEMYGLDISPTFIKYALKNGYVDAKLCDVSCEKMPYDDNFFDAVICFDVLEHLIDPVHTLAEINRVLKDGGLLGIITPNVAFIISRVALLLGHHTDTWETTVPSHHLRYYTFNSLGKLLTQAGFKILKIGGYPIGDFRSRKMEVWRYFLWLLAKVRPQVFAREIILLTSKCTQPTKKLWEIPPVGTIKGLNRLKTLWKIT